MARSAPPTKKPSRPFVVQILDAAPFTRSKTLLSSSSAVTEMNDTTAVGSLYPCFLHQPGLEYSGLWETGETMQASKWPISQHTALYSKLIHNFFFGIQKWNQKWLLLDLRIKSLKKKSDLHLTAVMFNLTHPHLKIWSQQVLSLASCTSVMTTVEMLSTGTVRAPAKRPAKKPQTKRWAKRPKPRDGVS